MLDEKQFLLAGGHRGSHISRLAVVHPGQGATYAITRCPGVRGQHFKSCRYSFSSKSCPSRRAGILARFVHDQQLKTEAEAQ